MNGGNILTKFYFKLLIITILTLIFTYAWLGIHIKYLTDFAFTYPKLFLTTLLTGSIIVLFLETWLILGFKDED